MRSPLALYGALLLVTVARSTTAIQLDVNDQNSIKNAASTVAYGLMKYYTGNVTNTTDTIGLFPFPPYYWWESGACWGGMVDYWKYTQDLSYVKVTHQALVSQVGPLFDYMVPKQQKDEGNDDQAFWGFAIMSAAEENFPPPPTGTSGWLQLTENLWNTMAARWDTTSCNGGLKWQIFPFNNGYDYKNSVSNGAFFQLSARLAHLTGNATYIYWANRSWNWSRNVGFISDQFNVYDGADDKINCSEINKLQFSYSTGIYLYGAAVMSNIMSNMTSGMSGMISEQDWANNTAGLLKASSIFFTPLPNATDIMFEQACETILTCDTDQLSFKAYLSRFMWKTTVMAPFTASTIYDLLSVSAQAAAGACSGGADGTACGSKWYIDGWDGSSGVGQQLSALETIQGLLITGAPQPPLPNIREVGSANTSSTSGVLASAADSAAAVVSTSPSASPTSTSQKRARVGVATVAAAALAHLLWWS